MKYLHDAGKYLIKNFSIYQDMQEVENEINADYLAPILEKICKKLSTSELLPKDWVIDSYINIDANESSIYAYPKKWKKWDGKEELAHISFGNFLLNELLSKNHDDRSWFVFDLPLANKRDKKLAEASKRIKQIIKNNFDLPEGYEISEDYGKSTCFYKLIDRMPVYIIESEELLIEYVAKNFHILIQAVDEFINHNASELNKIGL